MESSDQRPLKVDQGNLQTANQGVNNTKEAWLPWTTVNQERSRASERDNQAHILTIMIPVTRGSHLHVTCRSVCDHNQVFWSAKSVVDHLIVPFWGSWSLDFQGSMVTLQSCVLDCWLLAVWRSPWSLDRPPKRALIAWFNFDPGRKRFYTGHASDYLLSHKHFNRCLHDQGVMEYHTSIMKASIGDIISISDNPLIWLL